MVVITGMPYNIPMVYLKVAGIQEPLSLPFVEALVIFTNVKFDYRASIAKSQEVGQPVYVISGDTDDAKNKTYVVSKAELITRLQFDIYNDRFKITDLVIQPEDERLLPEVRKMIGLEKQ